MLNADGDALDVSVVPELEDERASEVAGAQRAVTELRRYQREAAAKSRAAAKRLKGAGLSGRDIAVVLGVSPQRASPLTPSASPPF